MVPFDFIRFAGKSDVGRKRKNNEDNFGMFPSIGVWLVADGMGGGDDGEVASAAVVRAVEGYAQAHGFPPEGAFSASSLVSGICDAIDAASSWILNRAKERGLASCGSTVVGVAVDRVNPGRAIAFHAGDSRLYRLRGRGIKQITKDHSAAEEMGVKDESQVNPMFRSVIMRAVGIKKTVDVERTDFDVKPGDRVLICSDGLSRMVPDKRIAAVSREEADVGAAVGKLIAAANEAGGHDNITVVLLEVGELPPGLPGVKIVEKAPCDEPATPGDTNTDKTMVVLAEALSDTGDVADSTQDAESETRNAQTVPAQRDRRRLWLLGGGLALVLLGLGAALAAVAFRDDSKRPLSVDAPVVRAPKPTPRPLIADEEPQKRPAPVPSASLPPVPQPPAQQPPAPPPSVLKPAEKKPVVSLRPEKPHAPSRTAQPPQDDGLSELVRVLERRENLSAFESAVKGALRDANADGNDLDSFIAEMKKVKGKTPRFVNEMRLTKGVANVSADFVVDFQYALRAADVVRKRLAVRPRLLADWDAIKNGDEKSAVVRKATSRLIMELPELLK